MTSEKYQDILEGFEFLIEMVTGLPFETALNEYNFILRSGMKFKENDIYRNFYYHAPNGRKDIQSFYREKDLLARQAAQAEADKRGAKSNPINNQNHIYGKDKLLQWLKDGVDAQKALYFAPHSIDSGITINEINKFNSKSRVIRIENDDAVDFDEKLKYFEKIGFPKESLLLHSGSKSPHHIFTFGNGETLPEIEWERIAELEAQMLRHSGFDGYSKTIKQVINDSKTMMLRIPGSFHQKTKKATSVWDAGDWWNIEDLENQIYNKFPKLGDYKIRKPHGDLFDTYEAGVQDIDIILSPQWGKRFKKYESYQDTEARLEREDKERTAKIEKQKIERERLRLQTLATLTPEEIEKRNNAAYSGDWNILDFVAPMNRNEVQTGTLDGVGRSHMRAYNIAMNLLEVEDGFTRYNLKYTLTAEDYYSQWQQKTFNSSEKNLLDKTTKTFSICKKKARCTEYISNRIEAILYSNQNNVISKDVIKPLIQGKSFKHLVEEATRGLKLKKEDLSIDDMPLLVKDWHQAIKNLTEMKTIYVTTSSIHAVDILDKGIGFCVYVTQTTDCMLLHQFCEICTENGYQIAFLPNACQLDRVLAEQIRNGLFSDLVNKKYKDIKVQIRKPHCVVLDNCTYGAQYYWQRLSQVILPDMIGNRSNKSAIYTGFVGENQWFNEVLHQCEEQAKSKKLIALISEMGTGKTEAVAKVVKQWNTRVLAVAHRENLTNQAAKRLGLVYYKDSQFISSADKYMKGQNIGLAVTINTLVQGSTDQGYLPNFNIEDWWDTTLFIDETESFIKYLVESSTIAENRQKAIDSIRHLVKFVAANGGRIVLADANLTTKTIKLFEKWLGSEAYTPDTRNADYNAYVILNTFKKLQGRKVTSVDTTDEILTEITNVINHGEKAMYFTDVKAASSRYRFSTQSYGMFCRDVLNKGSVLDADTKQFTDDIDHNILDRLHQTINSAFNGCVISVSPVIDSGTDWNNLGLNYVFACYKGIMGIDNTLQQLERVRDNIPRIISATRRSTIGIGKTDILNLESHFATIRNSYRKIESKLSKTWSDYQELPRVEIEERLNVMFPKLDSDILHWWQDSLLENFYGSQEFRINLLARMHEKGYEIEEKSISVDVNLVDAIKEFGLSKQTEKIDEISNADLALLAQIDKNDDTMPKATARAQDLKSCLYALSIKDEQWTLNFTTEERLEIVKRTLGKKYKTRRKLIYGFTSRCYFVNAQHDIADILAYSDDFKAAISSTNRSIKDTPISIRSAIDFLFETLHLKQFALYLYQCAVQRQIGQDGQVRMFCTNLMPQVQEFNKKLIQHSEYIRKTFGFKVDERPEYCSRNVSELFKSIGFNSENKRNRDEDAGKSKHGGNRVVHNFVITEDSINFKIWKSWVEQFNKKEADFLKYFYNPSGDEGGDSIWQKQLNIAISTIPIKHKSPQQVLV